MTPEEEAIIQQLIQYGMTPEEAFYYAAQQGLIFPEMGMIDASTDGSDTMGGELPTGLSNPTVGVANMASDGPWRTQAFTDPMGENLATNPQAATGSGWPFPVGRGGYGDLIAAMVTNDFNPGDPRPPSPGVNIQRTPGPPFAFGKADFGGTTPGFSSFGGQHTGGPVQRTAGQNDRNPGFVPGRSSLAAMRSGTSAGQNAGQSGMPTTPKREQGPQGSQGASRGKPPVSGDFKNYGQQRKAEVHARNDERKAARPTVAGSRPNPSPAQKAAPRVAAARAGARPATSGLPAGMKPPRAQPGSVPPPARASGAPTRTPYSQKPQTKIGGMLTKISRPSSTGFSGRR
jgi:hypothetical protein